MTDTIEISVNGNWVAVPALYVNGQPIVVKGSWLKIASVHDEVWSDREVADPMACVNRLRERSQPRADIFTFTQMPTADSPKYPYYAELDSVAAIRLTSFKEWWEGLPQEGRKNFRRSQKRGVEIKVKPFDDELIAGIRDVNNDSPVRQNEPNVHYGKSLEQVKRDHASFLDRCDFVCAYHGEEMIGYAKVVYRGEVASVLNFAPKSSHQDKRPANALLTKIVELCAERNISRVTYGMFNYGNKRASSLREFKERNGFVEILVPRFYIPLGMRGAVAMRLGLHRGMLGILPERVINFGITSRTELRRIAGRLGSRGARSASNPPAHPEAPPQRED